MALRGELTDLAGELRGAVVLLGGAERGGPAQAHVELEVRVTERLGECGELGQPLQPVARTSQHVERAVARLQQVQALLRGRGGGERELDDTQHLFRGVRGQRVPARLDREADAHGRVARGLRVEREQREALGGRLTREQEFDDRGVDRLPPRLGQRPGREIADLLVLEAVVGGRLLGVLGEQSRRHRRRERERQRGGLGRGVVHAELDLAQVLQAEVATEHGGIREQFLGLVGQVRRAARDEGLHRRGNQSLRVAGQPPDAVDLLDHPTVAVRARHLLDDERHALGLRMHDGGAAPVDRAAEDRRDEIPRLRLCQAVDLHPAEQAHPVHVRQEVHGLGHQRELLGPDREHQEDRARGIRADDVPKEAEAVVVGPLKVIDQDGERSDGSEGPERDGAQIERPQEPAIGRQGREARVILAGHRVEAARERLGGLRTVRGHLDRFG